MSTIFVQHHNNVKFVFKHLPLNFHPNAHKAAQAAVFAHKYGKFWQMHDKLFKNTESLDQDSLLKYANELGLDADKLQSALDNGTYIAEVDRDIALAQKLGITGTPSFVINGKLLVGAQHYDALIEAIDKAIEQIDRDPKKAAKETPVVTDIGNSPVLGPSNAQITMTIFGDFQCPFTQKFQKTLDSILSQSTYANNLKIVFKHMPLDFHSKAQKAAQAAAFAHKYGKFWEMHDLLFENQSNLDVEDLLNYANELGLDANELKAALDNETYKAEVDRDIALAQKIGIYGTPTFVINGKIFVGAHPVDYITKILDDEVTKATLAAAAKGKEKSNTAPTKLVKKVTEDRYEISRELVENIRKNPNSLKNNPQYGPLPQIQPIFKDGDISGIKLRSVQEGSIYSQLGLKTGDLIIAINGQVIKNPKQVMTLLDAFKPGQNLILQINRSGKEKTLTFQLK